MGRADSNGEWIGRDVRWRHPSRKRAAWRLCEAIAENGSFIKIRMSSGQGTKDVWVRKDEVETNGQP